MKKQDQKILIVEDEVGVRKNIVEYLNLGFKHVYEASDGVEALRVYKEVTLDLIITDINMPNMDGLSLVEEIRKENKTLPIIIISAYSDKEKLLRAVKLNLTDYIIKPIERKVLKALIKEIFSRTKLNEEVSSLTALGDGYTFDLASKALYKETKRVDITRQQRLLLEILVQHQNKIVSAVDIFFHVQENYALEYNSAMVRNLVKNMRKVLLNDSIQNIYGSGYMLVVADLETTDLSIYDDLMESVALFDRENILVACNRVMVEMFGYKNSAEILGHHMNQFVIENRESERVDKQVVNTRNEIYFLRKDKSTFLGKKFERPSKVNEKEYKMMTMLDLTETINRYSVDALTLLRTRSVLEQEFNSLLQKHNHHAEEACAVFIDIDDFKTVNDTYGHQAGDILIKEIASILVFGVRKEDVVVRWGGDEFLILLFNTSLESAYKVTEHLRREIAALKLTCCEQITCSFGLDALRSDDTLDTLVSRIDHALIEAKGKSKNCVVYFNQNK